MHVESLESVDRLWQSTGWKMRIISGDFNLSNVNRLNSNSGLPLLGMKTIKSRE